MPFTVSHSAAALPFRRTKLIFQALFVGCMAPDFLYFLRLSDVSHVGHTLRGLFLFSLPAGVVALFVYYRLLRAPAFALMPDTIRKRMPAQHGFHFWPASRFLWITICVLLGAASHILWDAWTHMNGIFVRHWPVLRHGTPFLPKLPWFGLLQHLSSVIGLLVLAIAMQKWVARTEERSDVLAATSTKIRALLTVVVTILATAFGLYYGYASAQQFPRTWMETFVVRTVIGFIAACFYSFVIFAIAWHLQKRKAPEAESLQGRETVNELAD